MAKKKSKKSRSNKGASAGEASSQVSNVSSASVSSAAAAGAAASSAGAPAARAPSRAKTTAAVRGNRRKKQQRTNVAIIAGVATVVIVAIVLQVVRQMNLPGERFASQGNVHLVSLSSPHVPYNSNPPTSGPHMPSLAGWGSYTEPVEEEYLIHNMEDAGVILWYEMGTPEENEEHVAALEEVSSGYERIVIAPREELGSTYALTAWTRMQRFDGIDEDAMVKFIEAYEGIDHHPR